MIDWLLFSAVKNAHRYLSVFHLASEIESDFPFARKKKKK